MSRRVLPVLLMLVAAVGCGGGQPTTPEPKPEPTTLAPPTTAAQSQADPNAPSGDRTFEYWQAVARVQELTARRYAALADPKPDAVKPLLADAAKGIDGLPTEKVDPDALAVGKAFADALRQGDAKPFTADAAGKARTTRAALVAKYHRDFPALDLATGKEPAFHLARDLARPTVAQELARLKGEMAELDDLIKPESAELSKETDARNQLSVQADNVRAVLKEQTADADLKKVREEVLADAVRQLEASKKVIDELTKKLSALRTKRGVLNQLAVEAGAILADGDPAKADKLPYHKLEGLRTQTERLYEKLAAQKK
jgi:hypothetical protein